MQSVVRARKPFRRLLALHYSSYGAGLCIITQQLEAMLSRLLLSD